MGLLSRLFGGGSSTPIQVDYSAHTDDELRGLMRSRADLTEVAQRALDAEFAKRGLSAAATVEAGVVAADEPQMPEYDSPAAKEASELIRDAVVALSQQQDFEAAIEHCERAIAVVRDAPKDEPVLAGTAHQLIAQTWILRERWEEAQAALEQSIAMFQKDGDQSAHEVLQFTGDLCRVLERRGLTEEAERRLREVLEYGRRVIPGEPIVAALLEQLAGMLRTRGMETEAAALEEEAQDIYEAQPGEEP